MEISESKDVLTPELEASIDAVFSETSDAQIDAEVEGAEAAPESSVESPGQDHPAIARQRKQNVQDQKDELEQEGIEADGSAGESVTDEPKADDAVGDEPPAPADKAEVPAHQVDPMHRFAAQEAGWSDADIDNLAKMNPALAARTFSTLADAYTNLSRQYLPAASPVAPGTQAAAEKPAQTAAESKLDDLYKNLAAFGEANGTDIVDKFLKPLQAEVIEPLRQMMAAQKVAEQRVLAQEANSAFDGLSKGFEGLYGKDVASLTDGQKSARNQLGILADQIRAGAAAQGKSLTVSEALKRAHGVISADFAVANARQQVQKQVQRRSNQITARPTQRKSGRADVPGMDKAVAAFTAKAAEIGLDDYE